MTWLIAAQCDYEASAPNNSNTEQQGCHPDNVIPCVRRLHVASGAAWLLHECSLGQVYRWQATTTHCIQVASAWLLVDAGSRSTSGMAVLRLKRVDIKL